MRDQLFSLLREQLFLEALLFRRKNIFKKINRLILFFSEKDSFVSKEKISQFICSEIPYFSF